nr:VOC family protein [Pseudomonas aeruginosa]
MRALLCRRTGHGSAEPRQRRPGVSRGNDNLSLGRAHAASNGLQTMDHYGFVVDSVEELEAWYRYLKALGVTLLDHPFDHGDGARSFHLLDPAGNKVQPLYHPAVSGQRLA